MEVGTPRRTRPPLARGSTLLLLATAAALLGATGCGLDDFEGGFVDTPFVSLTGPFPAAIEGRFEIAEISDAGGDDYYAVGWVETREGDVSVYALGQVLEAGGAQEGGQIRARVEEGEPGSESYRMVEVTKL